MRLLHSGMALPAPAMARQLVTVPARLLGQPGRQCDGTAARVQGRRQSPGGQGVPDPAPAHARPIVEVTFHAEVPAAGDLLDDLVDRLVAFIAVRNGKLRALFDVHHHGNGKLVPTGPGEAAEAGNIPVQLP